MLRSMANETEKPNTNELEILLNAESNPVTQKYTTNGKSSELHSSRNCHRKDGTKDDSAEIVIERDYKETFDNPYYMIPVLSTTYKISVYKPLVPLRIALFLWYGAGKIPVVYLNVFMKLKGLSLEEYSWIFSLASVFQFIFAFVSGITADRFGNAKCVLLTHVFVTIICILSLLFAPKVKLGSVTSEGDSKNSWEESFMDFNECEEFNGSSPILPTVSTDEISKVRNYSEEQMRQIIESLKKLNASREFKNPVQKALRTSTSPSNTTNLPCNVSSENCTELKHESSDDVATSSNRIIFVYLVLITILMSSWSTVYHFLDITIMSFHKGYKISFGYEYFFAISGYTFITFVTSVLLNNFAVPDEHDHCQSLYLFSAGIMFLSLISMCFIQSHEKTQSRHMFRDLLRFVKNRNILVFIAIVFLFGTSFGFIDKSNLWSLEHLNAPKLIFSLQQTLSGLYGLPFLFTSLYWFRMFGPTLLLVMAFFGYSVLGIGYALLFNPWLSLLLEAPCIVTRHLMWVTVIIHSHNIAPESLSSTIIALLGATHYGIGRIAGSLCFGLAAGAIGPRIAFGVFSGMNSLYAVCYFLFMYTRKTRAIRECN